MDKSAYLLYHNHKQNIPSFKIKLNGIEISQVKKTKLLGVWLDDQLKGDTHTNKLLNKLKCGIGMLKCSKNLLSSKAKRLLYFGQIHSNLCYLLCIWGSMLQGSMLKKIANAQKKAVKLIDPKLDIDELFRKHKILKFIDMVKVEQCKLGYKLCHDLLPKVLANNMVRDHNMHSTNIEQEVNQSLIYQLQQDTNIGPASCSMQSNCTVSLIKNCRIVITCLHLSNAVKNLHSNYTANH